VSERSATDPLREWTSAMQSLTEAIGSTARQSDVARQLMAPMQRQAELVQEVLDRERELQAAVVQRAFAPLDAIFDLLEGSGAAMRSQAEAVEDAARSLERVASLMKAQAELFERTVGAMREPSKAAKALAGTGSRRKPAGDKRRRRSS
jgi:methyl-accepting chemotaxis protein